MSNKKMFVRFIGLVSHGLKNGNIYEVELRNFPSEVYGRIDKDGLYTLNMKKYYFIKNDFSVYKHYESSHFIELHKERDEKLEKILNY